MYTFDANIVSDLHKEAFGYRPSHRFWMDWEQADNDGKQALWDRLYEAAEDVYRAEKEEYAARVSDFERILQAGSLWVTLSLSQGQIAALTDNGIALGNY